MLLNSLENVNLLSIQIDNKLKNLTCSVRVMVLAESGVYLINYILYLQALSIT